MRGEPRMILAESVGFRFRLFRIRMHHFRCIALGFTPPICSSLTQAYVFLFARANLVFYLHWSHDSTNARSSFWNPRPMSIGRSQSVPQTTFAAIVHHYSFHERES